MKKAAVILAPGFEEGEAVNVIDILRRAGVACESVGLEGKQVTGSHNITLLCDRELAMDVSGYDMIVLPGGLPGGKFKGQQPFDGGYQGDGQGRQVRLCRLCGSHSVGAGRGA